MEENGNPTPAQVVWGLAFHIAGFSIRHSRVSMAISEGISLSGNMEENWRVECPQLLFSVSNWMPVENNSWFTQSICVISVLSAIPQEPFTYKICICPYTLSRYIYRYIRILPWLETVRIPHYRNSVRGNRRLTTVDSPQNRSVGLVHFVVGPNKLFTNSRVFGTQLR